jgi:hypothetical protein
VRFMNRRRRVLAALFALFALLTSQLAVSAYVCGVMGTASMAVEVDVPPSGDTSDPCPGTPDTASLCEQHCSYGHSAVDQGKPLPTLDVGMSTALRIDGPYALRSLQRSSRRLPPLPPEPPAAIRFSVLRI